MRSLLRLALFALAPALLAQSASQRPAITGIAFVTFAESQPGAAAQFYGKELGLAAQPERGNGGQLIAYPVNASQWIETTPAPLDLHDGRNSRLEAVGLRTSDIRAMQRFLRAKGLNSSIRSGRLVTQDPEGNTIIFVDSRTPTPRPPMHDSAVSHRIIHAGFVVQSEQKENTFYRDILGFKPYWHGGFKEGVDDWVSQQVPDGTDWIEYMLNVKPDASAEQRGGSNHVSLGLRKMDTAIDQLKANGCDTHQCTTSQMGRDGKVQLNIFDPDHSRIELMEYAPSGTVCCSPFTGPMPSERDPL
ncbi:VOC family protein [Terriglobus sp.]|uniref:VOC family protein n=1 Tax=Terriglobus sp. TaxID=1889013 RepID=UPI003AFFEE94